MIFPLTLQFFNLENIYGNQSSAKEGSLRTSAEELGEREWLEEGTTSFEYQGPWYSEEEGDSTDVDADISNGMANYIITTVL